MKNTKQLCAATVFIYPSKDKYVGVCLELDLVDEDRSKEALDERMKQRVESYLSFIQKKNFDDSLLNRPAPKKYWSKFYQFLDLMREEERKRSRSLTSLKGTTFTTPASDFVVSRQSLACEPA
jgi:hypothetical protein